MTTPREQMADRNESAADAMFVLLAFLLLLGPSVLWWGWIVKVVWNLWMPPAFGLAPLTMVQAVALNMVRAAVMVRLSDKKDERTPLEILGRTIGVSLCYGLFLLGLAAVGAAIAW